MSVITNTIEERLSGSGVTIDGLLIQDGALPNLPGAGLTAGQAAALAAYEAALAAAEAEQVLEADGAGGVVFTTPAGSGGLPGNPVRVVLVISQSGTSAPTLTTIYNETGLTITPSYLQPGFFALTFSAPLFEGAPDPNVGLIVHFASDSNSISNFKHSYHAVALSSTELVLLSLDNYVAANAIFNNSTLTIDIYAVP